MVLWDRKGVTKGYIDVIKGHTRETIEFPIKIVCTTKGNFESFSFSLVTDELTTHLDSVPWCLLFVDVLS